MNNLENFAQKALNAEEYPDCDHVFSFFKCSNCENRKLKLNLEHHTGSSKEDFKGKIFGFCPECQKTSEIFSFTGDHRSPEHTENPACKCGNTVFVSAQLERFENDESMPGFFDEGVIVGECCNCGEQTILAFTD